MNVLYIQESYPWPCIQLLIIKKKIACWCAEENQNCWVIIQLLFSCSVNRSTKGNLSLLKLSMARTTHQHTEPEMWSLKKRHIFVSFSASKTDPFGVSNSPFLLYCFLSHLPIFKVIHTSSFFPHFLTLFLMEAKSFKIYMIWCLLWAHGGHRIKVSKINIEEHKNRQRKEKADILTCRQPRFVRLD